MSLETIFKEWIDKIDHPIYAIETGCSFSWTDDVLPHISTLNIVEHLIKPTDGILFSFDNDISKIAICRDNLVRRGLGGYVHFVTGDSVESLKRFSGKNINFVWLDSSEDANHAIAEFNGVQQYLAKKHVICVDDYGCANSVKWQAVSYILKNDFYSYKTYETPTGLIVGYRSLS